MIRQWVVNAAFNRGNSGGPVVLIETGEVIGVVSSKLAPISPTAKSALDALEQQKSGFTYEGTFRQHMIVKGRNRDTAWFSMTDGEWPSRKAAFEAWLAPENFDSEGRQRRGLAEVRSSLEAH